MGRRALNRTALHHEAHVLGHADVRQWIARHRDDVGDAGEKATKFGINRDRFEEAIAVAPGEGLSVEVLHFHLGSGGGLGVRLTETDVAIDIDRWAAIIARHAARRGSNWSRGITS